MAPPGRPRGRPKKVADLDSSAPSSRASSTRRATRLSKILNPEDLTSSSPIRNDVLESVTAAYRVMVEGRSTRTSMSSISNSNNESSEYSTPATSAFATPAPQKPEDATTVSSRSRRRMTTMDETITPAANASIARAAALRNANKRKRLVVSDSEDADEDNSTDAQLARALQQEEDEVAAAMSFTPGNPRKVQKILPKSHYVIDSDEEMFEVPTYANVPRVLLSAHGSNRVSFESKNKQKPGKTIMDTDDSDNFSDIAVDSDDVEPVASQPAPRSRMKKQTISRRYQMPPPAILIPRAMKAALSRGDTTASPVSSALSSIPSSGESAFNSDDEDDDFSTDDNGSDDGNPSTATAVILPTRPAVAARPARGTATTRRSRGGVPRAERERQRLEQHHPELHTMWQDLENLPKIGATKIEQPKNISRQLKPFQLEGVAWMKAMEETEWGGGLLGDEMGMGKTIQAVTLIMSDWPAPEPTLVLIPPVALMQWQQEIADYTDGTLKTFVYHGTNAKTKGITKKELRKYNVILMSYNSLESMYRKQEKGFKRKAGLHKEDSVIHKIRFHRVILDEAHNIKTRTTGSAKACFALQASHKWCLSGTPLQNRIGEFFSLVRFLDIRPFACYFCKQCDCSELNWEMDGNGRCTGCKHSGMQHVSVFNQELLNPIQTYGNNGPGKEAFKKLRILTDRFMLRRVKRDHSSAMELPAKEIYVDRQFFGEEENDFAGSIMNNGTRKFETYVAQGVLLNNYANIFGLIMQMRQVADHPDLILKKNGHGGQNILVCCICDEPAEDAIRSACRHEFCRDCAKNYLRASDSLKSDDRDCPTCHIPLAIDLEQPEIEQDEQLVKKSSIINRIKMDNWTSSSKIEALVHDLYQLRSKNMSHKSIIFSQFTTMLQLVEWRLRRAGITTVMLDGSMTPAQRQASINHFMTDVNVECFLVSLKAGGVALNLTQASKVFIVDPWWNPAAEWQSADRCHRIGQARPCQVTRLCIEDSVESRMVLLQEKKANMINSTINADDSAMESLTPEDMQFLFRGN